MKLLNPIQMRACRSIVLISLSLVLVMDSCVSNKKLTYLQFSVRENMNDMEVADNRTSVTPAAYEIMPYDNLFIRVVTPDPQWSALFNMDFGQAGLTQESAGLSGYPVDVDGNIEIPYVGKIKVSGKTTSEIKADLDTILKNYVTDASITVRLVNNFISILGEVSSPGRYSIEKDLLNIFEALAMAGDMGNYSNRQKVQLIRPSPYGPIIKEFSLLDRSILTSEYYYVMPNDIIYVKPISGRAFEANSSIYTLILTTVTTALVILQFFNVVN